MEVVQHHHLSLAYQPPGICRACDTDPDNPRRRNLWTESVREFHEAFGQAVRNTPTVDIPSEEARLRQKLVMEEAGELWAAIDARDIVGIADGIADLLYVTLGTALAFGVPIEDIFAEVHRSNLTKYENPPRLREDGKALKGPDYQPPDIRKVLSL